MTAQAATRLHRLTGSVAYWTGYVGAIAVFVLAAAIVFMPLGHVIFEYWTPKVQAIWQPSSQAVKVMRGGR